MTGRMIEKIETILKIEKPDLTLVYGDTNSTLAGAIASSKLNVPIAHVEAGLRSFNKNMPEETNRKLTDHISDYLFCPTIKSIENLKNEGITSNMELVGDIMYDCFLKYQKQAINCIETTKLKSKEFCLLTLHRQENTHDYEKISNLLQTINRISLTYDYKVVFPMHPRIFNFLECNNFKFNKYQNIFFISPLPYVDMICLEKNAKIIFTDSGGIQKEAYWAKTPCITLREETEWVELLDIKMNVLTGLDTKKIKKEFSNFESINFNFSQELYGDGKTGQKILDIIMKT
jgi:UDP-N-acetylglucosamine 2-epimerase